MSYMIKEMPEDLRPRERFKKYGVESLSNEELLSILIRCGSKNKSVKDVSIDLLKEVNINDLVNINYNTLKKIKGIGEVKAITIISAIEFGKRALSKRDSIIKIRNSDDIYNLVKDDMSNLLQEKLMALYLDTKNKVIDKKIIFIGTVNASNIYLRDVFRDAVKCNATNFILVHNHPAGSSNPSMEDVYMTNTFIKMGRTMDIKLLDHLIIGNGCYYSFREMNGDLFNEKS